MLKLISSLFSIKEQPKPAYLVPAQALKQVVNDARKVPRYPPFDHGVPVIDIPTIIDTQSELIQRIKIAFGLSPAQFDDVVMTPIRNYAAYVHLLPVTNNENHNNAGGLFRLGLEVGFYALQSADGKIYSTKESAEKRRQLHPKWVLATFIAGLCSEIYRPNTTMSVVSSDGKVWPSLLKPLYQWAVEVGSENYFIQWNDDSGNSDSQARHSTAAYVLNMVLPQETLQYLNNDNSQIVPYMFASITGSTRHSDGNLIGDLVRNSLDSVVDKDIKSNATFYGKLTVGSHLSPQIIDVMRELIKTNKWTINDKSSRIWYTKEGCFIVWEPAFRDISDLMSERKVIGMPATSETLAEMLLKSELIESQKNGSPYWEITLPGNPKLVETVKLSDPNLILSQLDVDKTTISLLNPASQDFFSSISKPNKTPQQQLKLDDEVPVFEDASKLMTKQTTVVSAVKVIREDKVSIAPKTQDAIASNEQQKSSDVLPATSIAISIVQKDDTVLAEHIDKKAAAIAAADVDTTSSASIVVLDPMADTELAELVIKTAPAASVASTSIPNDILEQAVPEVRLLLNSIKSDYLAKSSEWPIWMTDTGVMISKREFESHGMPHIKALDALVSMNWLVRDQETKKLLLPTDLLYKDPDGEKEKVKCYLLNLTIAQAIGFKDNYVKNI